jgi:hypothetical protein
MSTPTSEDQTQPYRFALLLLSLLFLAAVSGFAVGRTGEAITSIAASLVLLAGLASMYRNRALLVIGIILLLPAIATRWLRFWAESPDLPPLSIAFSLLFTAFNAGALFVYIQRRGTPSNDTIYGGICVYVLLGYCFAGVFALLETLSPGAFRFADGVPSTPSALEMQMSYFSFVTLSTLGYGDITPLTGPAKSLAMIEAVIGPMFVAVFLARLVGVRTSRA